MARWSLCALLLLQAALVVLAQETITTETSNPATPDVGKPSETPTRMPSMPTSTVPPINHGANDSVVSTAVPETTVAANNKTQQKNAAAGVSATLGMASLLGVLLCAI